MVRDAALAYTRKQQQRASARQHEHPALKEWPWEVFVRSKQGLEHKYLRQRLHAARCAQALHMARDTTPAARKA